MAFVRTHFTGHSARRGFEATPALSGIPSKVGASADLELDLASKAQRLGIKMGPHEMALIVHILESFLLLRLLVLTSIKFSQS